MSTCINFHTTIVVKRTSSQKNDKNFSSGDLLTSHFPLSENEQLVREHDKRQCSSPGSFMIQYYSNVQDTFEQKLAGKQTVDI